MRGLKLAVGICLALGAQSALAGLSQFCNASAITIPNSGAGTPYPSPIVVSGLGPSITTFQVELNGITHTFPDDIDILLVGPTGASLILQSDVGGGTDVTGISLTYTDGASLPPDAGPLVSGTFAPSNVTAGDAFAAPAPAGPYGNPAPAGSDTQASEFAGTNPNGTWELYVIDDAGGDLGSIDGGWCIAFGSTPVTLQSFDVD